MDGYSVESMSHGLKDLEAPSSTMSTDQGFPTKVATVNHVNNGLGELNHYH